MVIALVYTDPGEVTLYFFIVSDPFAGQSTLFALVCSIRVAIFIRSSLERVGFKRPTAISTLECLNHDVLYILVTLISQII